MPRGIPYADGLTKDRFREAVIKRDGFRCVYCGCGPFRWTQWRDVDGHAWNLDHVVPRVAGGTTTLSNVVTACRQCNFSKNRRTVAQAQRGLDRIRASRAA